MGSWVWVLGWVLGTEEKVTWPKKTDGITLIPGGHLWLPAKHNPCYINPWHLIWAHFFNSKTYFYIFQCWFFDCLLLYFEPGLNLQLVTDGITAVIKEIISCHLRDQGSGTCSLRLHLFKERGAGISFFQVKQKNKMQLHMQLLNIYLLKISIYPTLNHWLNKNLQYLGLVMNILAPVQSSYPTELEDGIRCGYL